MKLSKTYFMARKPWGWKGNQNPVAVAKRESEAAAGTEGAEGAGADGVPKLTKNQEKKLAKEKAIREKKAKAH